MRSVIVFLLILTLSGAVLAAEVSSREAPVYQPNFWTEFDITFWQTMPFAAFWVCVIDRNVVNAFVVSSNARWQYIIPAAVLISVGNAYFHANKVMAPAVKSGG